MRINTFFTSGRIRWIAAAILAAFFIGLGLYTAWRTHYGSTDFDTYYYAARRIASGEPVYMEIKGLSPYIYPPFFACLMIPLTAFNMETASLVWYAANLAFFYLSILICAFFVFGKKGIDAKAFNRSFPFVPKALFLAVSSVLFLDNIAMLQVNILIFFAVLLALYFFRKGNDILSGLFLGMAISIKITPVLFLAYFLFKREFRASFFTVLWLVIFSFAVPAILMGHENTAGAFAAWNENMFAKSTSFKPNYQMMDTMFAPSNQSVQALLTRIFVRNDCVIVAWKRMNHAYPPFLVNWNFPLTKAVVVGLSRVATFLFLGATFFSCAGKIKDKRDPILNNEYALIFLISLIANPVLRVQQLLVVIFPALVLLSAARTGGKAEKDYTFFYTGFVLFSAFYLAQGIQIFKIFGFGALSVAALWYFIMVKHKREKR